MRQKSVLIISIGLGCIFGAAVRSLSFQSTTLNEYVLSDEDVEKMKSRSQRDIPAAKMHARTYFVLKLSPYKKIDYFHSFIAMLKAAEYLIVYYRQIRGPPHVSLLMSH